MKNSEGQSLHGIGCNCANERSEVVYGPGSEPKEAKPLAAIKPGVSIVGVESAGGDARMHLSCGCSVTVSQAAPASALQQLLAGHQCRQPLALVRA